MMTKELCEAFEKCDDIILNEEGNHFNVEFSKRFVVKTLRKFITPEEVEEIYQCNDFTVLKGYLDRLFDKYDDSYIIEPTISGINAFIRNQLTPICVMLNLLESYRCDGSELALKLAVSDETLASVRNAIEKLKTLE